MFDPTWIHALQAELETDRANFDSRWQEIADYIVPASASFTTKSAPGTKRGDRVFDSTGIVANVRFAAAMQSMLTPSTQRWHALVPVDKSLERDQAVRRWADDVTERLFAARYAPRSQWGQAIGEAFLAFGAFGNALVEVADDLTTIVYRAWHPSEFYLVENHLGVVDALHRKCQYTARQAVEMFGASALPPEIVRAAEKAPMTQFEFIQVVMPMDEARRRGYERPAPPEMRIASAYYSCLGRKVVREGAYRRMPFAIARYQTHAGERYGRGPGDLCLADVKMLNEMMKTIIRAAHRAVDPPLLLPTAGTVPGFATRPGALNYGAMSDQGAARVQTLESGGDIRLGVDLLELTRRSVHDTFNVSLFQILVDKPTGMTATEAMIRAQEKGALMAPVGQRAQGEFLGAIIARELDILEAAGMLPEPPPALMEAGGTAALKVEFSGPIAQAQKAGDGVAIANFSSMLTSLVEAFPDVLDRVDEDELVDVLADVHGIPDRVLRDMDAVKRMRSEKRERADMAGAVEAAPQLGAAAKDLAAAQAQSKAYGAAWPPPVV